MQYRVSQEDQLIRAVDLPDAIPGYREAIEAEARTREAAFLRVPEFICGIRVEQLTVRHVALLAQLGIDGEAHAESLELFLWVVSPRGTSRVAHQARCVWAFMRHGTVRIAECADAYMAEAFADAPGGRSAGFHVDNTSWISRQCDLFAMEYGWSIETVMELPMKVAFQLEREIRRRHDAGAMFFNPSDKIRARWLETENRKPTTGNENARN